MSLWLERFLRGVREWVQTSGRRWVCVFCARAFVWPRRQHPPPPDISSHGKLSSLLLVFECICINCHIGMCLSILRQQTFISFFFFKPVCLSRDADEKGGKKRKTGIHSSIHFQCRLLPARRVAAGCAFDFDFDFCSRCWLFNYVFCLLQQFLYKFFPGAHTD